MGLFCPTIVFLNTKSTLPKYIRLLKNSAITTPSVPKEDKKHLLKT